ncbi:hypothetical protein GL218_01110 [Daldinia childiae]|uniref:uncharacterized protein n=1 Tax=Daldinia childiae TaxID=326645 RepID=UPI0014479F53|nr:uncharacterized protein GL218_01110 [Daldinia childiae]KAF3064348.1 hypothetical protein GL218_01110 [Daldinia childiae]
MATNSGTFPQDLPSRPVPTTWKSRYCWSFSWHAYSLHTSDMRVLARRISMITTLGIRTALSILSIVFDAYNNFISGMVIGIIFSILGFLFVSWCLACIGEAEGTRRVCGMNMGRLHFDIFLFASSLIHIGSIIGFFTGMGDLGYIIFWYGMWILITVVAWIATRAPEQPSSHVQV